MFTQSGAHAYNTESMNMKQHSDTDSPAAPGLVLSNPPHIKDSQTVKSIMWMVVAALVPAVAFSIHLFGVHALVLICAAVATAVAVEALMQLAMKKPITVTDGSAVLTGLLLAMNVPPHAPIWMVAIGSAFSIIIAKQLFGGLGYYIFNPALAGRAFLVASWPVHMTTGWHVFSPSNVLSRGVYNTNALPDSIFNAITSATPLTALREAPKYLNGLDIQPEALYNFLLSPRMLKTIAIGNIGGCIGETSAVLLFPFFELRMVAFHVFSGGVFLGAFFMATDMVTSPVTRRGMILFGAGCGIITSVIRLWGGYPEGVSYSILLMNATVPLIDRYFRPRVFGTR
jgi:electron transport complex protein RnfD